MSCFFLVDYMLEETKNNEEKGSSPKNIGKCINVKLMYVLADCSSLKTVYLLLKSVWKAGQICSFAF